jgi:hypothetical protein
MSECSLCGKRDGWRRDGPPSNKLTHRDTAPDDVENYTSHLASFGSIKAKHQRWQFVSDTLDPELRIGQPVRLVFLIAYD